MENILKEYSKIGKYHVRIVDWSKYGAKLDIRKFRIEKGKLTHTGKGIRISLEEAESLLYEFAQIIKDLKKFKKNSKSRKKKS